MTVSYFRRLQLIARSVLHLPDWMPGAGFKRKALEWRRTLEATRDLPFEFTKGDMLKGTAPISFSSLALSDIDERANKGADDREYREMVARNVAATLYTAGADTVSMPPAFRGRCTHDWNRV